MLAHLKTAKTINYLKSGACVLAAGGICCIDEFDKMSDRDRWVRHKNMIKYTFNLEVNFILEWSKGSLPSTRLAYIQGWSK